MPLDVKPISIRVAVICFFCVALIGLLSNLSAFTCCKRALVCSVVTYIMTTFGVKMINAILINAMVKKQLDQERKAASERGD